MRVSKKKKKKKKSLTFQDSNLGNLALLAPRSTNWGNVSDGEER